MNGREQGLTRGALYATAPQITTVLVALGLSPYIVAKIGLEAFGFWGIILAVLAFAQAADGGFATLAARHIAAARVAGNDDGIRQSAILAIGFLIVVGALLVAASGAVVLLLRRVPAAELPRGWEEAVVLGTVALSVTMIAKGFGSIAQGFQRWDVIAVVVPTSQVATALATVVALEAGQGLEGVAIGAAFGACLMLAGHIWMAFRIFPLSFRGGRPSRDLWREYRGQGTSLQIVALVSAVNAQADRILLLPVASLSWIGAYSLGSRMAVSLRAFPVAAFAPLLVDLSRRWAEGGLPAARAAYERAMRIVVGYGVSGLFVAYGAMYAAVLAWLGSSFTVSATSAVALGFGYAVNVATGPATSVAIAGGRAQMDRDYNLLGLTLNLCLTAALAIAFGPWGVVAATTIALCLSSAWLLARVARWLHSSTRATIVTRANTRRLTLAFCVGAIGVIAPFAASPQERLSYMAWSGTVVAAGAFVILGPSGTRSLAIHARSGASRRNPTKDAAET